MGLAVDVQGAATARPWYEKHELTYPTLVDAANALGRVVGYKVVPNQFYVDELGVFHGNVNQDQLAEYLSKPLRPVPSDLRERLRAATPAPTLAELRERATAAPNDYAVQLATGKAAMSANDHQAAVARLTAAARLQPESAEAYTELAAAHLAAGDKQAAATALQKGLGCDPDNWLIHKQIWALRHPDRFYNGPVDFKWQREQLKREAAAQE